MASITVWRIAMSSVSRDSPSGPWVGTAYLGPAPRAFQGCMKLLAGGVHPKLIQDAGRFLFL